MTPRHSGCECASGRRLRAGATRPETVLDGERAHSRASESRLTGGKRAASGGRDVSVAGTCVRNRAKPGGRDGVGGRQNRHCVAPKGDTAPFQHPPLCSRGTRPHLTPQTPSPPASEALAGTSYNDNDADVCLGDSLVRRQRLLRLCSPRVCGRLGAPGGLRRRSSLTQGCVLSTSRPRC